MIDVVGKRINSDNLSDVKTVKFYSIIAYEVTDISYKEQLSLSLCYVLHEQAHKVFIDYVEVERITERVLANAILQNLAAWGLSAVDMQGQCYDGVPNMSGARSGCKAIVHQEAPMVIYIHV